MLLLCCCCYLVVVVVVVVVWGVVIVVVSRNEWSQWFAVLDMFTLKLYQSKVKLFTCFSLFVCLFTCLLLGWSTLANNPYNQDQRDKHIPIGMMVTMNTMILPLTPIYSSTPMIPIPYLVCCCYCCCLYLGRCKFSDRIWTHNDNKNIFFLRHYKWY